MLETNAAAYQTVHLASIFVGLFIAHRKRRSPHITFVGLSVPCESRSCVRHPRQTWLGLHGKYLPRGPR